MTKTLTQKEENEFSDDEKNVVWNESPVPFLWNKEWKRVKLESRKIND